MAAGRVTTELRCLVGRLYIRSLDVAESFKHLPQGFELARPNTFDAKVLACLAYCAGRRAERRVEGSQCPAQFTGRPTPWASHPFSQPIAEFDHQIGHESACKPSLSYRQQVHITGDFAIGICATSSLGVRRRIKDQGIRRRHGCDCTRAANRARQVLNEADARDAGRRASAPARLAQGHQQRGLRPSLCRGPYSRPCRGYRLAVGYAKDGDKSKRCSAMRRGG